MLKRGQITIFIIAALIILFLFGFVLVNMQKQKPISPAANALFEDAVNSYVGSCIDQKVKEGTTYFGMGPFSAAQISDYLNNNLADCADFAVIEKEHIQVETGKVSSKVKISDSAVEAKVQYPIVLHMSDSRLTFEQFDYSLSRIADIGEKPAFKATGAATAGAGQVAPEDIVRVSTDGRAEFTIFRGATYSGTGQFKVEERNFKAKTNEIVVGNKVYNIDRVTFGGMPNNAPPAKMKIKYEDNDVPKNYDADLLSIAYFDETNDIWVSIESTTDKTRKEVTTVKVFFPATFAIVVSCKPSASSVPQVNYTGWIYREQVYSSDGKLLNPAWTESGKIFATKDHLKLKLSGGAGWNDVDARKQSGKPKGKATIKDWDVDDKDENNAVCDGGCTRDEEKCKGICQDRAKEDYTKNEWKGITPSDYLSINKDGIKDGTVSKCSKKDCYPYPCGTVQNPGAMCQNSCPDKCTEISLATPNNYGYDAVADAGGSDTIKYIMRDSGNSCVAPENTMKIDLRASDKPFDTGGFCNDECKAKLNGVSVNVDDKPIPKTIVSSKPILASKDNKLEVEAVNKKDAASYARGHIDLITGTGAYKRCDVGAELKTNCVCGITNVNILEDVKKAEGDYGEWDIVVKQKKFCCEDGNVVDDASKCPQTRCPTDEDKVVLEQKHTGCKCGDSVVYDYLRDGPGYCCSEQTCEGTKCTKGQGLASASTTKSENDLNLHEYKLEYKNGAYSVYLDGKLVKTRSSTERPKQVHIGNELRPTSAAGTWTFLKVDSIKVTDGQGKDFFAEDFAASIDATKWIVDNGEGTVAVNGGWLELKVEPESKFTDKFPYVKSADSLKVFPDTGDFTLTLKMQYTKVTGHGTYFWLTPGILKIGQDDSAPGGAQYGIWRLRIILIGDMVYACGSIGGCGVKTCKPVESPNSVAQSLSQPAGCDKPNKLGVHTLLNEFSVSDFGRQLDKVKELTGECGIVKDLVPEVGYNPDINRWSTFVTEANKRKLVPVLRLQGHNSGASWDKPDPANNYADVAAKYAKFISDLETASKLKINYVEIWNEPNLGSEWGGSPNAEEYSKFLLAVSKAIREYDMKDGKKDTNILNGGLAVAGTTAGSVQTASFIDTMFTKTPELKDYIDVWSVHPYPPDQEKYKEELQKLVDMNAKKPIMITETAWGRCSDAACSSLANQISSSQYADLYKNIWVPDSNVMGITHFIFTSKDSRWGKFSLVNADSLTGNDYYNALKAYRESVVK